jgi:hypothetical protein
MISSRSRNVWVTETELLLQTRFRVSGLVKLLENLLPAGLSSIPYSWTTDMTIASRNFFHRDNGQLELALK